MEAVISVIEDHELKLMEEKKTIEVIETLPEGVRAELLDGQIYDMASPTRTHQRILGELFVRLHSYIREHGGACEVNMAPFAVYLKNDKYNYVEPDLCVVCDPEKLDDKGCHGAPDWVIEIVSSGSKRMDYVLKPHSYEEAGVREYWIVDAEQESVIIHDFEQGSLLEYSFLDPVKAGIYEDLSINFSEIHDMLA